jgi:hypothetical protein
MKFSWLDHRWVHLVWAAAVLLVAAVAAAVVDLVASVPSLVSAVW